MNCVEFERVLPDWVEGGHTPELQAHLDSCSACSNLLADLHSISSQAKLLQATDEPSPRVWNALEARLRSEGLLRLPEQPRGLNFFPRWRSAWLMPVAAALLIVAGIKLYHPTRAGDNLPVAKVSPPAPIAPAVSSEDQVLLSTVASRPPAQRARYRADLNEANAFIRDAEQSLRDDPNDAYTQQMLINAYEQKQMLYELAVDQGGQ